MPSFVERLMSRVEPEPNSGCWLWSGGMSGEGYGIARSETGRVEKVHRLAYRVLVGCIPSGLRVCHHCDTPLCVNPVHLFLGTARDNVLDMIRKGRRYDQRRWLGTNRDNMLDAKNKGRLHGAFDAQVPEEHARVSALGTARLKEMWANGELTNPKRLGDVCPNGHDLRGDGAFYVKPNGIRQCRQCKRAKYRAYYYAVRQDRLRDARSP